MAKKKKTKSLDIEQILSDSLTEEINKSILEEVKKAYTKQKRIDIINNALKDE